MKRRKQHNIFTIHGWSYSPAVWLNTPLRNANHLTLPGHGKTPFKSTNIEELSLEIGSLLPSDTILVGWSLGATIAYKIAENFPEKLVKLILIAPTPSFKGISQKEAVIKRFLKKLKRNFLEGTNFFRKLCGENHPDLNHLKKEKATKLLESFINFKLATPLKIETEILVGEEDTITGLKGAFETFKLTKGTLKVYPRENHISILKETKIS